jgi:IS5 family transposase
VRRHADRTLSARARRSQRGAPVLKTTIETVVRMGAVRRCEFARVIVDTTVQEKAIARPMGSRLLEIAREKIARLARRA